MCRFVSCAVVVKRLQNQFSLCFSPPSLIFNPWLKVQYMIVVTCHASVYTLTLMSLDRFLAVVHPINSIPYRNEINALLWVFSLTFRHRFDQKPTFRSIGVTWCVILVTGIPVMMSHGEAVYLDYYNETEQVKCVFLSEGGYNLAAFQVCIDSASLKIRIT